MTFGWENSYNGQWKCLQLATFASIDFKPVFYFLPKVYILVLMLAYHIILHLIQIRTLRAILVEQFNLHFQGNGNGGVGFNFGGSLDYWLDELPIAIRLYGQSYFIPQAPPFPELKTMFGSIGLSVVVILRRH